MLLNICFCHHKYQVEVYWLWSKFKSDDIQGIACFFLECTNVQWNLYKNNLGSFFAFLPVSSKSLRNSSELPAIIHCLWTAEFQSGFIVTYLLQSLIRNNFLSTALSLITKLYPIKCNASATSYSPWRSHENFLWYSAQRSSGFGYLFVVVFFNCEKGGENPTT